MQSSVALYEHDIGRHKTLPFERECGEEAPRGSNHAVYPCLLFTALPRLFPFVKRYIASSEVGTYPTFCSLKNAINADGTVLKITRIECLLQPPRVKEQS